MCSLVLHQDLSRCQSGTDSMVTLHMVAQRAAWTQIRQPTQHALRGTPGSPPLNSKFRSPCHKQRYQKSTKRVPKQNSFHGILLSSKPPDTQGNGWFLKRTIVKQNGNQPLESTKTNKSIEYSCWKNKTKTNPRMVIEKNKLNPQKKEKRHPRAKFREPKALIRET